MQSPFLSNQSSNDDLIFPRGPGRIKKPLNFEQVAVGVAQEAVEDVVLGVEGGGVLERDALSGEPGVPCLNIGSDKGDDDGLRPRFHPILLAKPHKPIPAQSVNPAHPLIQHQFQPQNLLIKPGGCG